MAWLQQLPSGKFHISVHFGSLKCQAVTDFTSEIHVQNKKNHSDSVYRRSAAGDNGPMA